MTWYGSFLSLLFSSSSASPYLNITWGGNITKIRTTLPIPTFKDINKEKEPFGAFDNAVVCRIETHGTGRNSSTWNQVVHINRPRELFLALYFDPRKLSVLRKNSYSVYGKRGQCIARELIIGSDLIGELRSLPSPLLLIPITATSCSCSSTACPWNTAFQQPLSLVFSFHYWHNCKVKSLRKWIKINKYNFF